MHQLSIYPPPANSNNLFVCVTQHSSSFRLLPLPLPVGLLSGIHMQALSGYHFPKQSCWLEHTTALRIKDVSWILIIRSSSRRWNHSLFRRKYFLSSSRRFPDNVRFIDKSVSALEPQRLKYSSAFDYLLPHLSCLCFHKVSTKLNL